MVTKIDAYKQAKERAKTVAANLSAALGRNSPSNDKHQLGVRYTKMEEQTSFPGAILLLHGSYGYYGSSQGYRAMDADVAHYMVRAINVHIGMLADLAIQLAARDAEVARKAAEDEARAVLTEVNG